MSGFECPACGVRPEHADMACRLCRDDLFGMALCRHALACSTCSVAAREPIRGWVVVDRCCATCLDAAAVAVEIRAEQQRLAQLAAAPAWPPYRLEVRLAVALWSETGVPTVPAQRARLLRLVGSSLPPAGR